MQEVIKNNPNLLNLDSIFDNPILVVGREKEHIDVLALTASGVPVIIECKRKSNSDMRYLIAQVFEYASKLNEKNYEDFVKLANEYFSSKRCQEEDYKGLSFDKVYKEFMKGYLEESPNIENIDIEEEIENNLEKGEFYLVIVVDNIDTATLRTINFLNEKLEKLKIEVIEIKKFNTDNTDVFVPEHINKEIEKGLENSNTAPGKISYEELLKNSDYPQIIDKFRELWDEIEHSKIVMGTKGFSARYKGYSILWLFEDQMYINRYFKSKYGEKLYDKLETVMNEVFKNKIIKYKKIKNSNKLENLINEIEKKILVELD